MATACAGDRATRPCTGLTGLSTHAPNGVTAPSAKRVAAVLDARRDEITARCRHVTVTALGVADAGTTPWRGRVYAIIVGLRSEDDLPARQLYYLDGVPMRFFVAGTFTAL